jgi:hypothetical protein
MIALSILFYCAAGISIVTLPFLIVNWTRYMRGPAPDDPSGVKPPASFPIKSLGFFVIPALVAAVIVSVMTSYARSEVLEFIRGISGDSTVYINQQPAHDAVSIISALKQLAPYAGHHSYATKRIRVDIHGDKGALALELGRDSGNPHEYWVFYPRSWVTLDNEIGRITTSALDGY